MGAIDRFLRRNRGQDNIKPLMKRLESAMLNAVKAAGGAAWYVPDDFLTLGQNLITNGGPFVNLTGWANTAGANSSISGSYLRCTTTAIGGATYSIQTTPGKQYLVSSNVAASDVSHGLRIFRADGSTSIVDSTYSAYPGVLTVTFTALDATSSVYLRSASSGVVDYSSVTVQEILSAKDYQDSAGTLPGYLGGTVGLQYDMAGTIGTELIQTADTSADWQAQGTTPPTAVNGSDIFLGKACRSVTFPTIASGGYTVCRAVDVANNFNIASGQLYSAEFEYALSRDLTAGESVVIALTGVAGIYTKIISAGAAGNVWSKGAGGQIAAATGVDSLRPYATTLNAPLTVYIRRVSCKLVSGNTVVQSTAANRPTITRIPRKLGPELIVNGNFDTDASGWTAGAATIAQSSGELQVTSTGAVYGYARQSVTVEVGKTYQIKGKGRLGTANLAWILAGTGADALAYTSTSLAINSTTQSIKSTTFAAKESNLVITLENNNAVSNATSFFDDISVREVLEWSYALTFDGTNDSLAAPASIIGSNLSQPYTMISWGRVGSIGSNRYMQGDSTRALGISTAGKAMIVNNGPGGLAGATTLAQGQLVIIEGVWDGSTSKVYLNGVQDASSSHSAPTGTPAAHNVGQFGPGSNFYNEAIGGCVVAPAVMTDAQRAAVRKFAAAQLGLSL